MTAPQPTARATVVIVNYNGASLLPLCLDGLRRQTVPAGSVDVVVVDNASVDGSRELLARDYPWVRVIASERNLGFAGGNNLALRQVETPYAVLLNNDAVPEPDWLENLLAPFEEPGAEGLGVVTGKVVFLPRFVRLRWRTESFTPGPHDPRELGARVFRVEVEGVDVTDKALWEKLTYGPEGTGEQRFRWTRPAGELLVPCPPDQRIENGTLGAPMTVTFRVAGPATQPLTVSGPGCEQTAVIGTEPETVELKVHAGTPVLDVINNVGGIVLRDGSGADRGFQEVDEGQYGEAAEVFTACGNGMALRREAGRQVGWFDEDFFLYYEDTDLSWRLRSAGWAIRYQPTAVLRHVHSATSKEFSPLWVFHVDRNRLLMLTKNATAGLALRAVLRYPLTSASMLLRTARETARGRRRPTLRPHLVRARVTLSYLRLLGPMLRKRRTLRRSATLTRRELERWLVTHR